MTFGTMIDIAIGLALVYLMLSLLAASITELIANVLSLRGKYLIAGINAMLTGQFTVPKADPKNAAQATAAQQIVNHPLIQSVHKEKTSQPSYVPATQFATAALGILLPGGAVGDWMTTLNQKIAALPSPAKEALDAIVSAADGKIENVRAGIERWFDQSMERVSGIYQRWTQIRLLAIGLLTAILFNVDTFAVVGALSSSETLRSGLVKTAESVAKEGEQKALGKTYQEAQALLDQTGLPIGWPHPAIRAAATPKPAPAGWAAVDPEATRLADAAMAVCNDPKKDRFDCLSEQWRALGRIPISPLQAIIGWLVTALAVSLGAPFWFNLMTQLLNLRKAGAKPPASGDIVPGGTPGPGKGATS